METPGTVDPNLVAPCGMHCARCSRFLAKKNGLRKSRCPGCRNKGTPCGYLFGRCKGVNHGRGGDGVFCHECPEFPCAPLKGMDRRYRNNWGESVIANQETIRTEGAEAFAARDLEAHRCTRCGGAISLHNGQCFACESVTHLLVIPPRRNKKSARDS